MEPEVGDTIVLAGMQYTITAVNSIKPPREIAEMLERFNSLLEQEFCPILFGRREEST